MVEYAALVDIIPHSMATDTEINPNEGEDDVLIEDEEENKDEDEQEQNDTIQQEASYKKKRGRKKRRTFNFHGKHPLYSTHTQCLRTKQSTLIYNAHPPKLPSEKPSPPDDDASPFEKQEFDKNLAQWYKAVSAFAQFYSICFLPHPDLYGDDLELELYKRQKYLSWETFADQIKEMEASNLLIDRLRLDAMFTYMYGLRSDHRKQMLLTNYRHRDSTKWSELEKKDASNFFASVGTRQHFSKDQDADDVHDQLAMKVFSIITKFRSL